MIYTPETFSEVAAVLGQICDQPVVMYGGCELIHEPESSREVRSALPFDPDLLQVTDFLDQPSVFWTRAACWSLSRHHLAGQRLSALKKMSFASWREILFGILQEGDRIILLPKKRKQWPSRFFQSIRIADPRFARLGQLEVPPIKEL